MTTPVLPDISSDSAPHLADETIALVNRWLTEAASIPPSVAEQRLAGVLRDPKGLDFTVGFVDGVVRPEDMHVAARTLRESRHGFPSFLPWPDARRRSLGGVAAPLAPRRRRADRAPVLRRMVGHLIIDATDAQLGAAIRAHPRDGVRLNVNLLGEAVLGETRGAAPPRGHPRLIAPRRRRLRVDQGLGDGRAALGVGLRRGRRRDRRAAHARCTGRGTSPTPNFINLDMEEYKDLDLTMAVFMRILDDAGVRAARGRHRAAGLPARRLRGDDAAAGLGGRAPRARRRRRQGAPREGREPADGAGRGVDPRLAARDLAHQAGQRHALQARPRLGADARADRQRAARRRRPQPLRRRASLAARRASAASARASSSRCCSAWRRARPRSCAATSAACCSTRRSCTRASSTSRSPT